MTNTVLSSDAREKTCGNCAFFRREAGADHGPGNCPFSRNSRIWPSRRGCKNHEFTEKELIRTCKTCGKDISQRRSSAVYCEDCAECLRRERSRVKRSKPKAETKAVRRAPTLFPGLTGGQIENLARKYGMHYGTFTAAVRAGTIKIEEIKKDAG